MNASVDAINHPVNVRRGELFSGDYPMQSRGTVSLDGELDHTDLITPVQGPAALDKNLIRDLAVNEEVLDIIIQVVPRHGEKFTPPFTECWCNGKGIEVEVGGKWTSTGWVINNKPIRTKRKYVEILLRSKMDVVNTRHDDTTAKNPQNFVDITAGATKTISILRDPNPAGADWLTKILYER